MIETSVHQVVSESAQEVLETMFFAIPDSVSMDSGRPTGELIAASLTFRGATPGRFGLVVSDRVARTLAENFTGCDDPGLLPAAETAGIISELANMVCGAVLSKLQSNATFDLGAPQATYVGADEPGPDFTGGSPACRFEFPEGALIFFFAFAEPM
jgi:CheY-specific phosphatase CheX